MIGVGTRGWHTFDRAVIRTNWRKINESPGKRAGLLVRKIARRSIRRDRSKSGNRPSRPGKPPRTRAAGDPLRKIFSVPEQFGARVIIGPIGFGKGGAHPVTEVHEEGLAVMRTVLVPVGGGTAQRDSRGRFLRQKLMPARRLVRYPKRDTMHQALAKAKPKLPALWRGSLN